MAHKPANLNEKYSFIHNQALKYLFSGNSVTLSLVKAMQDYDELPPKEPTVTKEEIKT